MKWTAARIRLFRDVGLCLTQEKFARTLGFAKRTIGNAERGTHAPGLALRHALDQALENASGAQRDRFLAAGQADDALAVLHLLEAERVAEQAVSRNASARTLINILVARERRSDTPGLRALAARAGLLP